MAAVCWTHQAQNTAINEKLTFIFNVVLTLKPENLMEFAKVDLCIWILHHGFQMIIDVRQINTLSNASSKSETPLKAKPIQVSDGCFHFFCYIVYVIIHMKIWYKMIFRKGWNRELRQRGGKEKQTEGEREKEKYSDILPLNRTRGTKGPQSNRCDHSVEKKRGR